MSLNEKLDDIFKDNNIEKKNPTSNIRKERPKFYLPISKIREESENIMRKRMNLFKNEQTVKITEQDNEKIYNNQNKGIIFHIDIEGIFNEYIKPEEEIYIKNEHKINYNETEDRKNEEKEKEKENKSISLDDSSLLKINSNISFNNSINSGKFEKEFNIVRSNYYSKYSLNDVILNNQESEKPFIPDKYTIKGELFGFLYPNETITYYITQSGFLNIKKKDDSDNKENVYNNFNITFNKELGLYFCGNNIEIQTKNGKKTKECAPNEFICKHCMELNKKRYEIKNNYLINICGRIAKINKGSYHCFGHFLCSNQIEDCIKKFSCEACKLLDLNSKYYF